MIRFLIRAAIFLVTAAIGLVVAWLVLQPNVTLSASGFIVAVLVFAIAQSVLAPFVLKMARRYAPALIGGIGLVSTFVALLIAWFFPGGLGIQGVTLNVVVVWVLATLIVWIVTALGGWLLPLIFLKERASGRVQGR